MNALPSSGAPAASAERWATAALEEAGCANPRGDASLLVADAVGAGGRRAERAELSRDACTQLRRQVDRRARREPLGYVRGRVAFRGLEILVDRRVFVPRQETELLVEAALSIPHGARVLEACTGSGAVALSLKHERPDLEITATDHSVEALDVAGSNATRLGLDVTLMHADGIASVPSGPFDAVVANPPYVAEDEAGAGSLPPEIEYHEPPGAFWAGANGLSVYRRFSSELEGVRWVAFEVGDRQALPVRSMLEGAGFEGFEAYSVPSGQVRVLTAVRLAA